MRRIALISQRPVLTRLRYYQAATGQYGSGKRLRACHAVSGTDMANGGIGLRACYTVPGADLAIRYCPCGVWYNAV
eukprot:1161744-Rhodomonas_salina.1